jgi:hypothetical protein
VCLAVQGRARKTRVENQYALQFREGLEKQGRKSVCLAVQGRARKKRV